VPQLAAAVDGSNCLLAVFGSRIGLTQEANRQSGLDDSSFYLLDSKCTRFRSGADHLSERRPSEVKSHTVVSCVTPSQPLSNCPMEGTSPLLVPPIVRTDGGLYQCESVVQLFQSTV
jgi:hypothetical protein